MSIARKANLSLGSPPRPPRPVYSTTMKAALERNLALLCANLGCLAIEARALWDDGESPPMVGEAVAGAAEGDVMRLKRIRRRGVRA